MIKVTLEKSVLYDRRKKVRGIVFRETDKGLQVGTIDRKTGCKIVKMEKIYNEP